MNHESDRCNMYLNDETTYEPRNFYDIYQIYIPNECFNVTHVGYITDNMILTIHVSEWFILAYF